jgi:hypothetical protein
LLEALARLFDVVFNGRQRVRRQVSLLDRLLVGGDPLEKLVPGLVVAFQFVEAVLRGLVDRDRCSTRVNS